MVMRRLKTSFAKMRVSKVLVRAFYFTLMMSKPFSFPLSVARM